MFYLTVVLKGSIVSVVVNWLTHDFGKFAEGPFKAFKEYAY